MFLKIHEPNTYQKFLLAAEHRTILHDYDQHKLFTYSKGVEGETYFHEQLKNTECVKIWDLRLDYLSGCQFDFLIFDKSTIFHIDIKNYTGSYQLVNQQFVSANGHVHADVISQLNKAHYKLEMFLKKQYIPYKLVSRILFVNCDYDLAVTTVPQNVLLPHQVENVVRHIQSIEPLREHQATAEKIISYHNDDLIQERIHYYPFREYKGGIRCEKCRRLTMTPDYNKRYIFCSNCRHRIDNKTALLQLIKEMSLLKNDSLQAAEVSNWSGMPHQTVKRMMSNACHSKGANKNRQYILK
ncbi:nuclease-related domain-containing protein [Macrococcus carouselicus]|uniref:NERD domain-containing protein n=1 Tax=Macrococcus carouselicus TaxID=69969 RepID=A0A9Q8CKH5_9STAP|nr:nuclease-related domain-containing protein [Macrococcus carouselicus]TDM00702.1 NERD domain-containing protein [Macrococcus carouselicus]